MYSNKQKTIKSSFKISGIGLHTGVFINMVVKPAPCNVGYVFIRKDIKYDNHIKAIHNNVVDTQRCTTIGKNGIKIHTVEHLLAALYAMGVDNCYIELDNCEVPILDGSSYIFVKNIENVGILEQDEELDFLEIKELISYKDPYTGGEIIGMPYDDYCIITMVDFNNTCIKNQYAYMNKISDFKDKISKSRTFCFLSDIEALIDSNLIKGGSLENSIIYLDKKINNNIKNRLNSYFNTNEIINYDGDILNNKILYFHNEAARHKLLDIIGDLALIGKRIKGKIVANRPGHKINNLFAQKIANIYSNDLLYIDKELNNSNFVYDINDIMRILPHRYPFLLIDKVISTTSNGLIGIKNVTINEPFFSGHFPGEPIMPGVLQIEAMAQLGGLFVLGKLENPQEYSTYFMKIEKVKFKKKIIPGDRIIFKLELVKPVRRGIVHMKGVGYVNNILVVEAEMMAIITKNK